MNVKKDLCVNGVTLPGKCVHEAGHAVTSADSSDNPVSLSDKPGHTDEGKAANAFCEVTLSRGTNESLEAFYGRRIAYIYAGVIAEAIFEVPSDEVEQRAQWLLKYDDQTDSALVERISNEMKGNGIAEDEVANIRTGAWSSSLAFVRGNRAKIASVAIEFHRKHELSDGEIRALLSS